MRNLKIAILGTRGIPNNYGGFEYAMEKLSVGLYLRGHEVTVYNSHNHAYQKDSWNGVRIVHCYDPENSIGTAGQFIYDFNCLNDARRRNFDVVLMMGYTSNSIWGSLYPKRSVVITNMDGLEWKRDKYSKPVQLFLKYAEKLAIRHSDFYIADSVIIQEYLRSKYGVEAEYIAYGADLLNEQILQKSPNTFFEKPNHFLLMARMEPENNVETILEGFHKSSATKNFIAIGDAENRFGKYLVNKFKNDSRIIFKGPVFEQDSVSRFLANTYIYFHGHSVGGTNPSLLQAMANSVLIASHNNVFNKSVLQNDALYFSSEEDVKKIVEKRLFGEKEERMINNNLKKINYDFTWNKIIDQYETFIFKCFNKLKP
jgi:glycosyltransferase involved in cell wall biosynthesis